LICPNDGETALVAATLDGVTVDDCPTCGGVWFQHDELRRAKDNAADWARWLDSDLFSAADESSDPTSKNCAECGEPMRSLVYPHSNVRVDVCDNNHGAWLDKGEFEAIVASLDELTNSMSVDEYQEATVDQLKDVLRPHESRWSEIKDFFAVFRLLQMRFGTEHPAIGKAMDAAARNGL
jgi:Zn-finger nucleic acid-binding protein